MSRLGLNVHCEEKITTRIDCIISGIYQTGWEHNELANPLMNCLEAGMQPGRIWGRRCSWRQGRVASLNRPVLQLPIHLMPDTACSKKGMTQNRWYRTPGMGTVTTRGRCNLQKGGAHLGRQYLKPLIMLSWFGGADASCKDRGLPGALRSPGKCAFTSTGR